MTTVTKNETYKNKNEIKILHTYKIKFFLPTDIHVLLKFIQEKGEEI